MQERVISFHYTVKNSDGQVIDKSDETPMAFLTGQGQIIPTLEEEMKKMLIGQEKKIPLIAKDAYGERDENLISDVERQHLPPQLEVGQMFTVSDGSGGPMTIVRVISFDEEKVTLDANHPLAGVDLEFDVKIVDNRAATPEEVTHGHAHGAGGHQH